MTTEKPTRFEPANINGYLGLGDIIDRLQHEDPDRVLPLGFANPHSYRGDYADLAFEPVENITIGDMLTAARSALGATYEGWKGGHYTMAAYTDCWISLEGESSDNLIGPLLLELLLTADHDAIAKAARALTPAARRAEQFAADPREPS